MTKYDYTKGKIYKIVANGTDSFLLGSCCEKYLCQRLSQLKIRWNKRTKDTMPENLEELLNNFDTLRIVLLENYPCTSGEELSAKLNEYLEKYKYDKRCLNELK